MVIAIKATKPRKVAGLSEVGDEMISAGEKAMISMVMELCQRI